MATIKIPTVKSTEVVSKVTFSDGIVITVKGANNETTRKPLYLAAYALAHPTEPAPVLIPPITENPVFVLPTGTYTEVSLTSGKTLDLSIYSNQKIKLKPGNYSGIYITGNRLNNIIIDASGVVLDNSTIELGSGNLVEIYGIKMTNNKFRVLRFDFGLNNFHLYNSTFINCGDYALYCNGAKDVDYKGTDATANVGLKIINNTFDNFGNIQMEGKFDKDSNSDKGFFKNPEIAYNTFKNNPDLGSAVVFENVEGYNIHHNIVDNINASNNNHNGIFFMQGSGKFHDNKLTNYQGNSIRAWAYSRGSTPTTIEIYNNICYNTRKYGGFEVQGYERYLIAGKTVKANVKVYNNTVGKMNTSKDWDGQLLDVYGFLGKVEVYNNLGFDMNTTKWQSSVTDMINKQAEADITESTNKYFPNASDAVTDLTTFKSKINGVGAVH
ncbi:MAG: hypothetical protein EOO42_01195 [Flavobacteriales bacterium]|nr:MAG: hypothetical protein EOO42_01195 [Flavobacteriales bacterium]